MATAPRLINVRGHTISPRWLNAQSHVLDLGANEGSFSEQIAARFGCRCYAVEPNPALFESIRPGPRISRHNLAIAPTEARLPMYISSNPEGSSLYPLPWESSASRIEVEGVSLEGFIASNGIPRVDLLKVDIEGAEIAMFDSASDQALRSMAQISVEFHAWTKQVSLEDLSRVISRLEKLGFFHISFSRRWAADSLFLNRGVLPISSLQYGYMKYLARPARLIAKKFFGYTAAT
jgi:FkbM family methyltransferase